MASMSPTRPRKWSNEPATARVAEVKIQFPPCSSIRAANARPTSRGVQWIPTECRPTSNQRKPSSLSESSMCRKRWQRSAHRSAHLAMPAGVASSRESASARAPSPPAQPCKASRNSPSITCHGCRPSKRLALDRSSTIRRPSRSSSAYAASTTFIVASSAPTSRPRRSTSREVADMPKNS